MPIFLLPVSGYPDVAPPQVVVVRAQFPGASARVIAVTGMMRSTPCYHSRKKMCLGIPSFGRFP
jgi:hypothetical protein